jgi:hypothetical protein
VKSVKNSIYFLFFLISYGLVAQSPEKIKVRKFESEFYFFQKGESADTISSGKHDVFYMKITNNSGCNTRIEVENGQLLKDGNDTTFRLKHMVNMNYVHLFKDSSNVRESGNTTTKKVKEKCTNYTSLINGSNSSPDPNIITIRFINIPDEKTYLINRFYYK